MKTSQQALTKGTDIMAKIDTHEDATDEFAGLDFDEYNPEEAAVGKYDLHVRGTLARDEALSASDPEAYASGKRTRVHILVPNGEAKVNEETGETTYPDVAKERRLFQDSARNRDRTARVVGEANQGDGYTKLSFILIPKQSRPRLTPEERAAREAAGEVVEQDDTDE